MSIVVYFDGGGEGVGSHGAGFTKVVLHEEFGSVALVEVGEGNFVLCDVVGEGL